MLDVSVVMPNFYEHSRQSSKDSDDDPLGASSHNTSDRPQP